MSEQTALSLTGAAPVAVPLANTQVQTLLAKERETMLRQIGSGIKLTKVQSRLLRKQASYENVDLLPSGELYVPGNYWRQVLNDAFEPMGWGVRPGNPTLDVHTGGDDDRGRSVMYREVFLVISRCNSCMKSLSVCSCDGGNEFEPICVQMAIGAQEYHPNNARMTYDDAAEACVTNGLMRCCKVFSLFENIWDKRWAEVTKNEIGVLVLCDEGYGGRRTIKPRWRRFDAKPLRGELNIADDSPNKDKYQKSHQSANSQTPQAKPQTPVVTEQDKVKAAVSSMEKAFGKSKAAPQPPIDVNPVVRSESDKGEKILVSRSVKYTKDGGVPAEYWVVNTDVDTYYTEDPEVARALETCKLNGKRIVVTYETRQKKGGTSKILIEFRQV